MADSTMAPQKKNRRSTAKSQKLEAARTRLAVQLAEERDREKRVLAELEAFLVAEERIAATNAACEAKVAELENRIARQRELARDKTASARRRQAIAALTMHEAGRKVSQVAELLQLSQREARDLIAAGRAAAGPSSGSTGVLPATAAVVDHGRRRAEEHPFAASATGSIEVEG